MLLIIKSTYFEKLHVKRGRCWKVFHVPFLIGNDTNSTMIDLVILKAFILYLEKPSVIVIAQSPLQREWGNFLFANWNGIFWGLPLQLVQLITIHFLSHLKSFMWERKFEKKFFKKSHIQTPNGVLLIFKLPFPNGSYRNGVCRALWAIS